MVDKKHITKRKNGLQTKDNILKESAMLFSKFGYNSVSVRKIAYACRIKESSIYNHFKSKDDILSELFMIFEKTFSSTRLSSSELEEVIVENSLEYALRVVVARNDQDNSMIDNIATIIFIERFNHEKAAELYTRVLINQQITYFEDVFLLINNKHDLKHETTYLHHLAINFAYAFMALSHEYAMAKNNMINKEDVIRKMMNALQFYVTLLQPKGDLNDATK